MSSRSLTPLPRRRVFAAMASLLACALGQHRWALAVAANDPPLRLPTLSLRLALPDGTLQQRDAASLAALGTTQITTSVPWNQESHVWEGVSLRRLLESVRQGGRAVRLRALNDYVATIPWSDLERFDPVLAWHLDGQPIAVRAKGPLLLIYPFSTFPELKGAEYIDRSVWHVSEVIVQ